MQVISHLSAGTPDRLQPRLRQRAPIAAMAVVGGLLVSSGAFMPWLSLFAGLQTYAGTTGINGRLLVGGGVLSSALGLWFLVRGGNAARWGIGVLGLALLGFCGWLLIQLLDVYRELHADPFVFSALRPGLFVATVGAASTAATLLAGEPAAGQPARTTGPKAVEALPLEPVLAALSIGAGIIHGAVIGPHWRESTVLALAFAAAALAQLLWAGLVLIAPSKRVALTGAALSAACVAVWAISRTAGLPLGDQPWQAEPVGTADLIAVVFEMLTLLGALALWRWHARRPLLARPLVRAVCTLMVVGIAFATLVAILDGTSALELLRR